MTDQPAANTDRELYREPAPEGSFGMGYYQPSVHVTESGAIGINVGGLTLVRAIEAWHRAALVADIVALETCMRCGHRLAQHRGTWLDCAWPECGCRKPQLDDQR